MSVNNRVSGKTEAEKLEPETVIEKKIDNIKLIKCKTLTPFTEKYHT